MKFKDFIQFDEVGTSTSCIASFKRISIPLTRRIFPPEIGWIDPEEKKGKKNPYRVPQIKENFMQNVGQSLINFGTGQPLFGSQTGTAQKTETDQVKTSKDMAKQLQQMAKQLSNDPSKRQLATLLTTMSSTYNRLGDQWTQTNNMSNAPKSGQIGQNRSVT